MITTAGEFTSVQPVDVQELLASLRRRHSARKHVAQLRAVLLLAGAVRKSPFNTAVDRCLLDLPVTAGMTLLDLWGAQFLSLPEQLPAVRMRVLIDQQGRVPLTPLPTLGGRFSIERDPLPFRGTGGLLSDVVQPYDPNDYVLVADAAQVLTHPLVELFDSLHACDADAVMAADAWGQPAGVMLIRCGVLRNVQSVGYADLKEQVLPMLKAAGARIRVLALPALPTMAVRDAQDYLDVVRAFGTGGAGGGDDAARRFDLIEPGAIVSAEGKILDSVVLRGGTVKAGARVIRSIVCPGAVVEAGERVADQLVMAGRRALMSV